MESFIINTKLLPNSIPFDFDNYGSNTQYLSDILVSFKLFTPLCLFNKIGSGKVLKINHFDIHPSIPNYFSNLTTGDSFNLYSISSLTGGNELSPIKMDSSKSDPTGITVSELGTSTTGNFIRRLRCVSRRSPATGSIFNSPPLNTGDVFSGKIFSINSATGNQKIILREGEGISLNSTLSHFNDTARIYLTILDQNVSGFGTIMYELNTAIHKVGNIVSVFNNSGSGKTIEISSIIVMNDEIYSVRTAASSGYLPTYYLMPFTKIGDYDSNNNIDVIKCDSSASLNANILALKDVEIQCCNDYHSLKKNMLLSIPGLPHGLDGAASLFKSTTISKLNQKTTFNKLELNEGEGVGLIYYAPGNIGIHEAITQFSVEDVVVPPSGGNTYSRSRVVN